MFPAGVAPDLCIIDRHGRVFVDRETAAVGSYDAIRVYLWAGLSPAGPRSVLPLLHGLVPLLQEHGMPPEKMDAMTGYATAVAFSPPGFQGAVLPYLSALGATELLAGQQRRVETHIAAAKMGAATQYYDEALILFGAGWQERRYRFDEDGHLVLPPGR
jgi:endoglucanase